MIDSPSLAMASNVYRRLHGTWPDAIRLHPEHFVGDFFVKNEAFFSFLASVFEITVTDKERSPRLTVSGVHGSVTYDHGVEEADWDQTEFKDWLRSEAATRGVSLPVEG